jgi:cytochrome c
MSLDCEQRFDRKIGTRGSTAHPRLAQERRNIQVLITGATAMIASGSMFGSSAKAVACAMAALVIGSSVGLAAGDPTAGQQVFATRCSVCHATEPGVNKIGPSLAGVFGRKSGSEIGFDYSPALKAAAITWDEQTLDQFIKNPGDDVHGTKMFVSLPGSSDRQNVIAYLKTVTP